MSKNQKLEILHRNLLEQLEIVNLNGIPEFIESLKVLAGDLGDAIYLPDFNDVEGVPPESYSCNECGSTNLKTILMHEIPGTDLSEYLAGPIYIKKCVVCGHIYHVDEAGKLCSVD